MKKKLKNNLKLLVSSFDLINQNVLKIGQAKTEIFFSKIVFLIVLSSSFITPQLQAQQVRIYNTENSGLPHNQVTSIAIDAQGNKWFGTYHGEVVKFDDTNWTVYNQSNSGLSGDLIKSIAIDSLDNVWVGTIDFNAQSHGELLKFDKTNWTVYNNSNSGLPYAGITDISIDALGNKWIVTDSGGVIKFDDTNWTVYNSVNTGFSIDYIELIEIDKQGNIWLYSGMNLFTYDNNQWTSIRIPEFDRGWSYYGSVHSIVIDAEGNKWMGTMEDSDLHGGVIKFDNEKWYYYNNNNNSGLPRQFVMSCAIDAKGNKWFGMSDWWQNEALIKFDGSNWIVFNSDNSDLPDMFIRSMVIDKKGKIWLGTGNSGVVVFNENGITTDLSEKPIDNSDDFTVYPNPAKDFISIDGILSGNLEIINLTGEIINTSEVQAAPTKINISNLPDGIYTIRITSINKIVAKKFIKN